MILHGSVSLLYVLATILKSICCPDHKREEKGTEGTDFENKSLPINLCACFIDILFTLFWSVLIIIGSVWVLSKYDDWNDAGRPNCNGLPGDSDKCCHEGMFWFAFIYIIVTWSINFLVFCFISRCASMCYLLVAYICRGCHGINKQQQNYKGSFMESINL